MSTLSRSAGRPWWPAAILGVLAACTTAPEAPVPAKDRAVPPAAAPAPTAPADAAAVPIVRARSRWIPADWAELPGWEHDRAAELWPALLRGCERPPPSWARVCSEARTAAPAGDEAARAWLQQRLQPYRVESLEGSADGMITGYFEPLIEASRVARGAFRVPLHTLPADIESRKPYWTRRQVDTSSAAKAQLRGRELAFVADPLDALILQIQGSGRLDLMEADDSRKLVRAAFAGHNDHPYKSVGRWLIERGELKAEQASWPAIKQWAQANPKRMNELLWSNPRVVFFREEPLPDPAVGPRGAQGVPLTPQRSIAVDAQSVPYGTPVWLDTTEPLSNTPLRRLVMAQDTGSAIVGAVRADFFWGWGDAAEQQAGRMKQPLRMWVLWPKS
ncbi:murein transglycosylase A [Piscinibacter sp.]|uniref:murein transglycosylase A n=1 Tax=Piscinibacter sp. TaxID=1903157 RepID=UPI002CC4B980|nr:MltA domain-containing protein [Albitalea sp.]HUG25175.1 MltA domain-containing protein [Albitalea sp.]